MEKIVIIDENKYEIIKEYKNGFDKEAFNNKNFMKMEKIYKEIEKNKVNTVSIEENIKEWYDSQRNVR